MIRLIPYALPFAEPLVHACGRFTHRRGWLLGLRDEAGREGWGDAAAWPGFGSSDEEVAAELGALDERIERMPRGSVAEIRSGVARLRLVPEVAHALELALLDLLGQSRGLRIAELLSPEVDLTVQSHALAGGGRCPGRWLKVKVGAGTLDDDEARVATVIAGADPDATLRLDAGGAWSFDEALAALRRLGRYRVRCLEQPLAPGQLPLLAELRRRAAPAGIAIAVDEEIRNEKDIDAVARAGAADEVVLKPMFLGGVLRARALARRARAAGLGVMITHALESAIGRAGALQLAATLPGVHGLSHTLASDVARLPDREGDRVPLPAGPGLGIRPDALFLAPHRAEEPRAPATAALPHPVASAAIARPDHPAIVVEGRSLSYRELASSAAAEARRLRARGLGPGSVVALRRGSSLLSWVTTFHALGWLGAAVAPLPERAPESEIARVLAALRPSACIEPGAPDGAMGDALPERFWPLEETRLLVCTSGTTGAPRLIPLSTLQLATSAFGSAVRLGHLPGDRWLCCLPLSHVAGLSILLRCAFYGTTAVLHDRFDPDRVARAIDAGAVTLVSLVPEMLERVLDAREARWGEAAPMPSTLRAILVGGGPLPVRLHERCRRIGAPIAVSWGMTEAASQVATAHPGTDRLLPLAFARVESVDGRLRIRGPLVAGQLDTGDAGTVAADGTVQVHGRADDIIITGGEKVAPAEIEAMLAAHPDIVEAAVVSTPSARWGSRPVAAIVCRREVSDAALRSWCRQRAAAYKVPDRFIRLPALPRTDLGKIARARLQRSIDEASGAEAIDQPRGRGRALHLAERHEGVHQPSGRAHLPVAAQQPVREGDRSIAEALHAELHVDPVPEADRLREVRLCMHERKPEPIRDEPIHPTNEVEQQLFEGLVAHLEHAAEEEDSGAVYLKEASGNPMHERHSDDRR